MVNSVTLIGNVGADPDIRYAANGTCIANLRLAVNDFYNDSAGQKVQKTYWFNMAAFAKTAEVVANYVSKGSKIGIVGKLIQREYQAKDGTNRSVVEIRIDSLELLGKKDGAGNSDGQQNRQPPNPTQRQSNTNSRPQTQCRAVPPPPSDYPDDDSGIPF
jgi:single-strand DNA-binding protein